jgi:esterase/lipase
MMEKKLLIPRSIGGNLHSVHYLSRGEYSSEHGKRLPFVIICHGFTGEKYEWGRYPKTAKALNAEGFDALIFDFSGSGENEREFITLSKQARDLKDVHAWSKEQGYSWIAVIGLSFGGLTTLVANLPEIKVIIFWAPAFHIRKFFTEKTIENLKKKPFRIASGDLEPIQINETFVEDLSKYDINSYLQKLRIPVLIVQGKKDGTVRPANTREAFKYLPQDEHHKLFEVEGATHDFDGEHLEIFIKKTITWLKKYR